jgi:hypothetical protein
VIAAAAGTPAGNLHSTLSSQRLLLLLLRVVVVVFAADSAVLCGIVSTYASSLRERTNERTDARTNEGIKQVG